MTARATTKTKPPTPSALHVVDGKLSMKKLAWKHRVAGLYWVQIEEHGPWTVAQWQRGVQINPQVDKYGWYCLGSDVTWSDEHLFRIGVVVIKPRKPEGEK